MNKHTRMAFLVAPFLAVLGWIASDYWLEQSAPTQQYFALTAEADYCDIMAKQCILTSGDVRLSVYNDAGKIVLNSTYPLDDATFFLVTDEGTASVFKLGLLQTPYYWYQHAPFEKLNSAQGSKQTFRIIATIKGNQYAGEFVSTTLGTSISKSDR
jgi:hypothetical protein